MQARSRFSSLLRHDVLAIRQHLIELTILCGLELAVVDLYTVIEVKLDTGKCQMADLLIVFPAFLQLLGKFILVLPGCCNLMGILAVIHHILHPVDLGLIHALHLVQVVDSQVADGVRCVAVQIGQDLKSVLLAAVKQPVDRTLAGAGDRISPAVILEEIVQEVIVDDLPAGAAFIAKGFCNVIEVCFQRIGAPYAAFSFLVLFARLLSKSPDS